MLDHCWHCVRQTNSSPNEKGRCCFSLLLRLLHAADTTFTPENQQKKNNILCTPRIKLTILSNEIEISNRNANRYARCGKRVLTLRCVFLCAVIHIALLWERSTRRWNEENAIWTVGHLEWIPPLGEQFWQNYNYWRCFGAFSFFPTKIKFRTNEIIGYMAHKFDRRYSIIITPLKLISSVCNFEIEFQLNRLSGFQREIPNEWQQFDCQCSFWWSRNRVASESMPFRAQNLWSVEHFSVDENHLRSHAYD